MQNPTLSSGELAEKTFYLPFKYQKYWALSTSELPRRGISTSDATVNILPLQPIRELKTNAFLREARQGKLKIEFNRPGI